MSTSLMKEPSMSYIVSITVLIFTFSCYSQHNYHDIHLLISFSDIIGSTTHMHVHMSIHHWISQVHQQFHHIYISHQWVLQQASYIYCIIWPTTSFCIQCKHRIDSISSNRQIILLAVSKEVQTNSKPIIGMKHLKQ